MKTFEKINGMWTINSAAGGLDCLLHKILITACEQDNPKATQSALKHGLNPKNRVRTVDYDWFCYIHICAIIGSIQVMKILASKVEIDSHSSECYTSLQYAILHNQPPIVNYLLGKGANVNANANSHGFAPLHTACLFTLRPKKQNNITSIMLAQYSYRMIYDINFENIKLLLDNGAYVHYKDDYSNTALNVARMNRNHPKANNSSYDAVILLLMDAMKFKIAGPFKTIDSQNITCPICLSDDGHFCYLDCCSHSFHVNCLKKWFNLDTSNKKCPTCRSPLLTARPVKK